MINYFLIFVLGLIVGSFLNCVIFRLKEKKSFIKERSRCPYCGYPLAWYDLIPVLSFIILRRRCRYCQKPISWQYPIVEMSTGLIFLLIFNFQFLTSNQFSISNFQFLNFIYYLLIACFLIVIFVYDLRYFVIPNKVLYPAIAVSLMYRLSVPIIKNQLLIVNHHLSIINYLFAALGAAGFFLAVYLLSKGKWLGFGDIKLAILLGLILGWPKILLGLFLSFLVGAIIGIGLIIFAKKKLKSEVPFAPFLIIGTFIALFWGEQIISWYLSLISYQ